MGGLSKVVPSTVAKLKGAMLMAVTKKVSRVVMKKGCQRIHSFDPLIFWRQNDTFVIAFISRVFVKSGRQNFRMFKSGLAFQKW